MPKARAFAASLVGTSLEYYDFAVYGAASALVLPALFFPRADPLTGLLLAFSTYAVGYLSRPLGGIVFGRLGDVIGRRRVLVATLLLIGIATALIGVLPTYARAGVVAPILLVLLRFAQGVGVGGEWGSAVLLSGEFGDARRPGFWSSAAQLGPPAGTLLSNGVLAVLTGVLSDAAFLSWGWRVAFGLSAVLVGVGLWIRLALEDTPVFRALAESGERATRPVRDVLVHEPRGLLAAVLARLGPDVSYSLLTVYVLSDATRRGGFGRGEVLAAVLIGSAVQLVVVPAAGALSDRVDRRVLSALAVGLGGAWAFAVLGSSGSGSVPFLLLAVVVGLVLHAAAYGPQAAFITEQFDPRRRSTGGSLGYTVAGVFGGAVAPLAFTALAAATGSWVPVAGYAAVAAVLSLVGLALGRGPVRDTAPADPATVGDPSRP